MENEMPKELEHHHHQGKSEQDHHHQGHPKTDATIYLPMYMLVNFQYELRYDQENTPYMSFPENSPAFPGTLTYAPPPTTPYLSMALKADDKSGRINSTAPTALTTLYVAKNYQTEYYEVIGTNLDGIDAYDYMMQAMDFLSSRVAFKWNTSAINGNTIYNIFPSSSSIIPCFPYVY